MPDIPTFTEFGYPQVDTTVSFGLACAATPAPIIARLSAETVKAI